MEEIHHHVERLVGVMDDQVLLPDRGETVAAVVADASGIARRIGNKFKVGTVEMRKLRHFVEREHAIDLEDAVVGGRQRALHEAPQLGRRVGFDIEPDHRTAAAAFERGLEQPHQIFGLFEDFQFRVADDAERAQPLYRVTREQLVDEQAGRAFDRNEPRFARVAGLRQTDEPVDAVRHADQRIHRPAVSHARKLQGNREAEIGNERERVRRIDGERRQQRKNVREKEILEPGLLRLADIGSVNQRNAGFRERPPQLAPLGLLILDQQQHGFGNAHKLLGGCQAFGAFGADAGAHLRSKAGDAHHEKFVEVVGRDREELQPLQQGIAAIGGFFENAPVEIEPGEFAVDKTVGAGGQRRGDMTLRRYGQPRRRFQVLHLSGFERDGSRLAAIDHRGSLFLELHPCRPSLQFDDTPPSR